MTEVRSTRAMSRACFSISSMKAWYDAPTRLRKRSCPVRKALSFCMRCIATGYILLSTCAILRRERQAELGGAAAGRTFAECDTRLPQAARDRGAARDDWRAGQRETERAAVPTTRTRRRRGRGRSQANCNLPVQKFDAQAGAVSHLYPSWWRKGSKHSRALVTAMTQAARV